MLQRLRNFSSSRAGGEENPQRRSLSFRRRHEAKRVSRRDEENRIVVDVPQPAQAEAKEDDRGRGPVVRHRTRPNSAEFKQHHEDEAKARREAKPRSSSSGSRRARPGGQQQRSGNSSFRHGSEKYELPELAKWLADEGVSSEYAARAAEAVARLERSDVEGYGSADVLTLCQELLGSEDAARYAKCLKEFDGDAFLETIEWPDYADVGLEKTHALTLCAVAKGVLGDFGTPRPVPSSSSSSSSSGGGDKGLAQAPSAASSSSRGGGVQLTAADEAALKAADALAAREGVGSVYGQLVVLGFKEYRVEGSTWNPVGGRNEKFELKRREVANGIRRSCAYVVGAAQDDKKKQRSSEASHSVTMSVAAARQPDGRVHSSKKVCVEYVPDAREDMFQLGRMIVPQNDFVVRGPLHLDSGGVLCGPVSRYACRLACSRLPPYECKLFAAGFNNEKDIFLSEMAPKWQLGPGEVAADDLDTLRHQKKARARSYDDPSDEEQSSRSEEDDNAKNVVAVDQDPEGLQDGEEDDLPSPPPPLASSSSIHKKKKTSFFEEQNDAPSLSQGGPKEQPAESTPTTAQWDALTTFGVRIWKPEIGEWREVSVHGGIHEPRKQADVAGKRYPKENSTLTNGTIVDLAGIQLLFESAESMLEHDKPDAYEAKDGLSAPDRIVARFNARRPQCPVQLHTIRLEYDDAKRKALAKDRTPYIFPACGHVHAYAPELRGAPCPLCRTRGPFVELKLEWEPAICDEEPEVAFTSCGHIVSERVARKWASLALPDNAPPNARYRPICPFCAKPLKTDTRNGDQPFTKILFQSSNANGLDDDANDDDSNDDASFTTDVTTAVDDPGP